ncbi:hypothetical protein ACTA71_010550 [Dictyostelium dimigraforme]
MEGKWINSESEITVQDVSPINTPYKKYTKNADGTCGFTFYVLNTNDDGTNTNTEILSPKASAPMTISFNKLSQNQTSTLLSVVITNVQKSSQFTVELYTFTSSIIQYNISCIPLDILSINPVFINGFRNTYSGYYKAGYVKLMGLDTSIFYDSSIGVSCSITCTLSLVPNTNIFSVTLSGFTTTTMIDSVTITFSNFSSRISSVLNYPLGQYYDSISTNIYPEFPKNANVQLNSLNGRALFTFTTNNTLDNRLFLIKYGGTDLGPYYFPISSTFNSSTYLGYIPYTILNTGFTVQFYGIHGNAFKIDYTSPTYIITKYWSYGANFPNSYSLNKTVPLYSALLNTLSFERTSYDLYPIYLRFYSLISSQNYYSPYGFVYGNNSAHSVSISVPTTIYNNFTAASYLQVVYQGAKYLNYNFGASYDVDKTKVPVIKSLEFVNVRNIIFIIRMQIESFYGVKDLNKNLVSGTLNDGTFEIIANSLSPADPIKIVDSAFLSISYSVGSLVCINPISYYSDDRFYDYQNFVKVEDISNITFLYNDLDITNKTIYNSMYLNCSSCTNNTQFLLYLNGDNSQFSIATFNLYTYIVDSYSSFWNDTIGLYQIDFIVPANTQSSSQYPYKLVLNNAVQVSNMVFPESSQLRVISNNVDLKGPIFKRVEKSTNGWILEIQDEINGFRDGYIVIKGSLDNSFFNITLNPSNAVSGDKYYGEYHIFLNITEPCISQNYTITDVLLVDDLGTNSTFSLSSYSKPYYFILNPFINYLDDYTINVISVFCASQNIDLTPPELLSFSLSNKDNFDVGVLNRNITITMEIQDLESGIRSDQSPFIYLSDAFINQISFRSIYVSGNFTNVIYNCTMEIPIGFGYPFGIYLSVYGLINNYGQYRGYSTEMLRNNPLFDYIIVTNQTYTVNQPIIISYQRLSTKDSKLWLYGRGFQDVTSIKIRYAEDGKIVTTTPKSLYSSALLISLVARSYQPIYVTLFTSTKNSNEFLITPYFYPIPNYEPTPTQSPTDSPTSSPTDSPTSSPTDSPTSSPTDSPTSSPTNSPSISPTDSPSISPTYSPTQSPIITPIPTNPPQKCIGNPECGGSNQGYCSNTGCVCYSPYVGIDCLSKIIIVPPPVANSSNPNVEIPTNNNNNNGNNNQNPNNVDEITFKSLISIVSLRELDYNSKPILNYTFEKWELGEIDQFKNQYFTNIITGSNTITNVTVTIEWFNQTKSIQFANQNLTMNPSTLKYTVEITLYNFQSQLNTLQLVMSASLESSKTNDVCSSKQFGNTSNGDDSNYLKVQVDDHSVYGRFIKRALVDGNARSIENVLLDSTFNPIESSYQSQAFIGIEIPNFKQSAIIDPDFSILLSSSSDQDSNSICSKSKNGLSGTKIAGIAIGCAAFAAVALISTIYFIKKKKQNSKFINNMNSKLKNIK